MDTVVSWRTHRARVGALSRDREPNDPDLVAARRDLMATMLEARVREAMESDHPPNVEQCAHIAALLLRPVAPRGVVHGQA